MVQSSIATLSIPLTLWLLWCFVTDKDDLLDDDGDGLRRGPEKRC